MTGKMRIEHNLAWPNHRQDVLYVTWAQEHELFRESGQRLSLIAADMRERLAQTMRYLY